LADEEDYDEEDIILPDVANEDHDENYETVARDSEPWYFKAGTFPFGILALVLAYGWAMLVWVNHLPSYLVSLSALLFIFGWMGVPLILGWWEKSKCANVHKPVVIGFLNEMLHDL
jgi:hypothetical protein